MPAVPDRGILPSLRPGARQDPEQRQDHASKSTDSCSQHKETPLVSSAHRSNLQPTSWEPLRLMGLIVTVFPCMKLRTETCIFNNERTSRGRAEEVPGRQKGGS